jgi:hypothetical protein
MSKAGHFIIKKSNICYNHTQRSMHNGSSIWIWTFKNNSQSTCLRSTNVLVLGNENTNKIKY